MKLKQVKYLIYALGGACILMVALLGLTNSQVFLWLTLVLAVAAVAVSLVWWRCPYCGEHLGRDVGEYCSHCGRRLDQNDLV